MAAGKGLLKSANFAESLDGFAFKEGFVRVDQASFRVHQNREQKKDDGSTVPGMIKFALVLSVTRLDEDQDPLKDEQDEDMIEDIILGLGSKALVGIHPGGADGPDDQEVEDLGIEPGTEGKTVFFVNGDYQVHPMTAAAVFAASLEKAGWKEEFNRLWAPDFVGSIFHMKSQVGDKKMKDPRTGKDVDINYKIVDKIVRAGYEAKKTVKGAGAAKLEAVKGGKSAAAEKGEKVAEKVADKTTAPESAPSKNAEAESILKPILEHMSETQDGRRFTRKGFTTQVQAALQKEKVEPKLHVPILTLIKDDGWLTKNSSKFDMTVDLAAEPVTITFGTFTEE